MPCVPIKNGIMCISPLFRLPLEDGRRVYMSWHSYCGPQFYHDKYESRPIDDWWEDSVICRAVEWFQGRGCKA